MDDLPYFLSFSVFPGIGPIRFRLLYDYFGSAKEAWNAPKRALLAVGLPQTLVERFEVFRHSFDVETYQKNLSQKNIRTLAIADPLYPNQLQRIPDAPFLLYIYGSSPLSLLSDSSIIAVVGTRAISMYGKQVTIRLTEELVSLGCVICSGLALGVDTVAHQTAIEQKGKTIAVLGCGVDIIAPASNAYLYRNIAEGNGLIISEMPLGHRPDRGLFPARNRIISGLSQGVVVTEGAEDSGSLITARNAAEQGREVFAVPGPITSPGSHGPAKLLKNGAILVESIEDISRELSLSRKSPVLENKTTQQLTPEELTIFSLLQKEPKHIDVLIREAGLSSSAVFSILTKLELIGIIIELNNQEYSRK